MASSIYPLFLSPILDGGSPRKEVVAFSEELVSQGEPHQTFVPLGSRPEGCFPFAVAIELGSRPEGCFPVALAPEPVAARGEPRSAVPASG